jgi:hypothetical protein
LPAARAANISSAYESLHKKREAAEALPFLLFSSQYAAHIDTSAI